MTCYFKIKNDKAINYFCQIRQSGSAFVINIRLFYKWLSSSSAFFSSLLAIGLFHVSPRCPVLSRTTYFPILFWYHQVCCALFVLVANVSVCSSIYLDPVVPRVPPISILALQFATLCPPLLFAVSFLNFSFSETDTDHGPFNRSMRYP